MTPPTPQRGLDTPMSTSATRPAAPGPNPEVVRMIFERFVEWKLEQEERQMKNAECGMQKEKVQA